LKHFQLVNDSNLKVNDSSQALLHHIVVMPQPLKIPHECNLEPPLFSHKNMLVTFDIRIVTISATLTISLLFYKADKHAKQKQKTPIECTEEIGLFIRF
jgi:hypothetical protein